MKPLLFVSLFVISSLLPALVQSDREAKQFLKNQGAGHGDFIEAADTLIIDSMQVVPKGSCCNSLPIKASVKKHCISCFKDNYSSSTANHDSVIIWTKSLPICAVRIRHILYIGRSFKEIANEILERKIH